MLAKPPVRIPQPFLQPLLRPPPQRLQPRHIQQLARRSVGLRGVEFDPSCETYHARYRLGKLLDRAVRSRSHVDVRKHWRGVGAPLVFIQLHDVDACGGHVVHVEEFAPRCTAPPYDDLFGVVHFGLVEAAEQGRDDVAVLGVIVVSGAVEVGRHDASEAGSVLAVVAFAHLDPGDLGDGVRFVGRFERSGEQRFLAHRLRSEFRVDAR